MEASMFDFIGKIFNGIFQLITDIILAIIIVLAIALVLLTGHRNANNPYIDHSVKAQIEADKEAQYREALQNLYNEYRK